MAERRYGLWDVPILRHHLCIVCGRWSGWSRRSALYCKTHKTFGPLTEQSVTRLTNASPYQSDEIGVPNVES